MRRACHLAIHVLQKRENGRAVAMGAEVIGLTGMK